MTHVRSGARVLVLLVLLTAVSSVWATYTNEVTIPPTATLCTEIESAKTLNFTLPGPAVVYLLPGDYFGCGSDTILKTTSGSTISIVGSGPNATRIEGTQLFAVESDQTGVLTFEGFYVVSSKTVATFPSLGLSFVMRSVTVGAGSYSDGAFLVHGNFHASDVVIQGVIANGSPFTVQGDSLANVTLTRMTVTDSLSLTSMFYFDNVHFVTITDSVFLDVCSGARVVLFAGAGGSSFRVTNTSASCPNGAILDSTSMFWLVTGDSVDVENVTIHSITSSSVPIFSLGATVDTANFHNITFSSLSSTCNYGEAALLTSTSLGMLNLAGVLVDNVATECQFVSASAGSVTMTNSRVSRVLQTIFGGVTSQTMIVADGTATFTDVEFIDVQWGPNAILDANGVTNLNRVSMSNITASSLFDNSDTPTLSITNCVWTGVDSTSSLVAATMTLTVTNTSIFSTTAAGGAFFDCNACGLSSYTDISFTDSSYDTSGVYGGDVTYTTNVNAQRVGTSGSGFFNALVRSDRLFASSTTVTDSALNTGLLCYAAPCNVTDVSIRDTTFTDYAVIKTQLSVCVEDAYWGDQWELTNVDASEAVVYTHGCTVHVAAVIKFEGCNAQDGILRALAPTHVSGVISFVDCGSTAAGILYTSDSFTNDPPTGTEFAFYFSNIVTGSCIDVAIGSATLTHILIVNGDPAQPAVIVGDAAMCTVAHANVTGVRDFAEVGAAVFVLDTSAVVGVDSSGVHCEIGSDCSVFRSELTGEGLLFQFEGSTVHVSDCVLVGASGLYTVSSVSDTTQINNTSVYGVGNVAATLSGSQISLSNVEVTNPAYTPLTITSTTATLFNVVVRDSGLSTLFTGSDVNVTHSVFTRGANTAVNIGGGSVVRLTNVSVTHSASTGAGGGILVTQSEVTITDSFIGYNSASSAGGMSISNDAEVLVSNTLLMGNTADNYGAGAVCSSSTCAFVGVTVASNIGVIGGGFYAEFSELFVTNTRIVDNVATAAGSAACVFTSAHGSFVNVVVRRNTGASAVESVLQGRVTLESSLFADNDACFTAFLAQPTQVSACAFTHTVGYVLDLSDSEATVSDSVFRDNSGPSVFFTSGGKLAVENSFVGGNGGAALECSRVVANITRSVVCGNEYLAQPFICGDQGIVVGDFDCLHNYTDCRSTCNATGFCVPETGHYAGPYESCFECGGACDAGAYTCQSKAECIDIPAAAGPYACACITGYGPATYNSSNVTTTTSNSSSSSGSAAGCVDIDECASGVDVDCPVGAECVNTLGSFVCVCAAGYADENGVCVDVEECEAGVDDCSANATCTNTPGSFDCSCTVGFYGSGPSCAPCPANSYSSPGSTDVCTCNQNFFRLTGTGNPAEPCSRCNPGYQRTLLPSTCAPCPPGTYSTDTDSLDCLPCPSDRTSVLPATSLDDCTCKSKKEVEGVCVTNCPAGQFAVGLACADCPLGTYANVSGLDECFNCPPYSTTLEMGSANLTECVCVPQFYFLDNSPEQGCQRRCPPGQYQEDVDSCITCPSNSYSDTVNAAECSSCPRNSVSPDNSSDITFCSCPSGYYSKSLSYGSECLVCPVEAKCKGGRNPPVARKGFHPVGGVGNFAECVPKSACAAGGECAEGYTGELCAACDTGYFRLDGKCRPCNNAPGLVMAVFFLCLLVVCAGLVWFNSRERVVNSFVSVAIGLNSLQITAMYGRLDVNWPEAAQKFFDALSLFNFNIELFAPECSAPGASAFWMRWSLAMFMPVFAAFNFAVVLAIGSALSSAGAGLIDASPRDLAWSCGRALAQLLTIVYLPLAATVLEYFDCVTDGAGRLVLATSRDTMCYDATYWRFIILALLGVLGYVVGIPAALGSAFVHSKRALGEAKFAIRFGFFVSRYDANYYWYEMVILARKFAMALAFSFLFSTGYFEAGAGLVLLLCFFMLHSSLKPYRTVGYNALESACVASSLGVLLISLTFQAVEANAAARSVGIVLMLAVNVLAIVVGVVYDCYQLVAVGKRVE